MKALDECPNCDDMPCDCVMSEGPAAAAKEKANDPSDAASGSLATLCARLTAAEKAILAELERQYPRDTWWQVKLRYGQTTPTIMQVMGYDGGVHAGVHFWHPGRPRSYGRAPRPFRRTVAECNILGPENAEAEASAAHGSAS